MITITTRDIFQYQIPAIIYLPSIYSSSKITSIHYIFFSFLATTLQPPLPTESSAEYNGDREFFKSFFHDIFPQKEFPPFLQATFIS